MFVRASELDSCPSDILGFLTLSYKPRDLNGSNLYLTCKGRSKNVCGFEEIIIIFVSSNIKTAQILYPNRSFTLQC